MITTIYDNLEVDLDEAKQWIRQYFETCEVEEGEELTVEEAELQRLVDSAKRDADNFIQREESFFIVDEEVVIPENIKQWVLEVVARTYEVRLSGEASRSIDGAESLQVNKIDKSKLMQYKKVSATFDDPTLD